LVWWDEQKKHWTGLDSPDYEKEMPPDRATNIHEGHGTEALGGAKPFTLHPDGVGWLYVATGLKHGPLPAEPLQSPIENPLYSQQTNPAADRKKRPRCRYLREFGRFAH
jgi:formate dehydrogenase major subunit